MSIDLNDLKEQIQTILQAANTTTATRPLSLSLAAAVAAVYKVNPARIPIQSSKYPYVTVYVDNKSIQLQDIAVNQTNSKRRADIDVRIAGAVRNNVFVNKDVDEADDDCESLMENIEQILRANPTLAGVALWSFPTRVQYQSTNLDSNTNIKAGVMNLRVTVLY